MVSDCDDGNQRSEAGDGSLSERAVAGIERAICVASLALMITMTFITFAGVLL